MTIRFVAVLDDDDVAVLDLIALTGGDLAQPRPLTGSAGRVDKAEEYTLEGETGFYSETFDLNIIIYDDKMINSTGISFLGLKNLDRFLLGNVFT